MFLRIVKAAGGKGVQHEYVRLVESYRQGGKVKQRLIASLGRKELLLEHLDALNRLLRGEKPAPTSEAGHHEAVALQAWDWGHDGAHVDVLAHDLDHPDELLLGRRAKLPHILQGIVERAPCVTAQRHAVLGDDAGGHVLGVRAVADNLIAKTLGKLVAERLQLVVAFGHDGIVFVQNLELLAPGLSVACPIHEVSAPFRSGFIRETSQCK